MRSLRAGGLLLTSALLAAWGCGKGARRPAGKPLPPLPAFTDAVAERLKTLPAEKDYLASKPDEDLEAAAQLAMVSDLRMSARGWRDLQAAWPGSAAALAPLLFSSKVPGEKKARILDWAALRGGRAAVQLCRYALECRPDQAVEPRRRAVALLGRLGGPAEAPVLVLRLKYEEYGDPYALAWTALSLARLKNLSGLPLLLGLLKRADLKEEAGRILVEILGMEGIPWKKGGTWADLEKKTRELEAWWWKEGRSHRDKEVSLPPLLERELLLRLEGCLKFNMRFQDDAGFILARMGKVVLPVLRLAFGDKHRNIRITAVDSAGKLGPYARVLCPGLVSLMGDRAAGIYAVEALGLLGCEKAGPYLLGLAAGPNPDLRQASLLALGRVGCRKALPLINQVLGEGGRAPEEKMAAALSLGLLGEKKRGLALLEAMKKDPQVHRPTLEAYIRELRRGPRRGM